MLTHQIFSVVSRRMSNLQPPNEGVELLEHDTWLYIMPSVDGQLSLRTFMPK